MRSRIPRHVVALLGFAIVFALPPAAASGALASHRAPVAASPLVELARSFHTAIADVLRELRAERRAQARRRARSATPQGGLLPGGVSLATLEAIAACESGGNPAAISPGGTYRGKYQFAQGTWESVGGHGDPAAAPQSEQDYRAALLYARSGPSSWPVCG